MKKFICLFCLFLLGISAQAEVVEIESNVNMSNLWDKIGKREEKVVSIGEQLLYANKIPNRVVFQTAKGNYTVNAYAAYNDKSVTVFNGLLKYVENDDELAAVLAHEIAHNMDYYDGFGKLVVMNSNRKSYEYKADLLGIDYMIKAGYNPLAMITIMNKISGESIWDFGVLWTHPKTSRRLMNDYEYIYKKYPQYLTTPMSKSITYVNWVNTAQKDIRKFQQKEKERAMKRGTL